MGTNELEGLRYHLYSELTESKKEIDTLRNDLQYWQNTTISILKKYLLDNQGMSIHVYTNLTMLQYLHWIGIWMINKSDSKFICMHKKFHKGCLQSHYCCSPCTCRYILVNILSLETCYYTSQKMNSALMEKILKTFMKKFVNCKVL